MRKLFLVAVLSLVASPASGASPQGWVQAQFHAFHVAGINILSQFFAYNSETQMYRAFGSALLDGRWVDPQAGVFEPDDPAVFCEGEPVRIMVHAAMDGVIAGEKLSHKDAVRILEEETLNDFILDGEVLPLQHSPIRRVKFDPRPGRAPEFCFPVDETGELVCAPNWGWGKTYGSDVLDLPPGDYEVKYRQNGLHCSWLDFPEGEEPPPWHPWWTWDLDACGDCSPAVFSDSEPFECTITTPFYVLPADADECAP